MKKITALFFALVMVLSLLPATVFAAEPTVKAITFEPKCGLTIMEFDLSFTMEDDDGEYEYYDIEMFRTGDRLTVIMSDDTAIVYEYDFVEFEGIVQGCFVDSEGNILPDFSIDNVTVNEMISQYEEHWQVGNSYPVVVTYGDISTIITYTVVENPVESIKYIPAEECIYIQGVDCYTDLDVHDKEFDYYEPFAIMKPGAKLIVYYKDGTSSEFVCSQGEYDLVFSAEGRESFYGEEKIWMTDEAQYVEHWGIGPHIVTVHYSGKTSDVVVRVVANPVKSISYVPARAKTYIEGIDSMSVSYNGEKYNYYHEESVGEGDKLIVTYSDDSVVEYVFTITEDYTALFFAEGHDSINPENLAFTSDQDENHWEIGNHEVTVSYSGKSAVIPVSVIENPVQSISFTPAKPYVFYLSDAKVYPELDNMSFYDNPDFAEGDKLTVNYKDGTSAVFTCKVTKTAYGEDEWTFVAEGREPITAMDYLYTDSVQNIDPWVLGSDNKLIIVYNRVTCKVPVTIRPDEEKPGKEEPVEDPTPKKAILLGDVDGNEGVSVADARLILRAAVMLEQFEGDKLLAADVDKSGNLNPKGSDITAADARLALRMAIKLDKLSTIEIE